MAMVFSDRRPLGPCPVEDISVGGMRIVAGQGVRRGRVVSVMIEMPGKGPVMSFAQVNRSQERAPGEHVLALSFLDLTREDIERLQELIAGLLAAHHPCLEFFDTDDDGRPKRMVLSDDNPVVG